jgi:hypothetical protein
MERVLVSASVVLSLGIACSSPESPAGSASPSASTSRREGRTADVPPDLVGMLSPVPEYVGNGRNLFAFGPPRSSGGPVPSLTESVEPETPVAPPTIPIPTPRPTTPSAGARLAVKYAGFLEKTGPDGGKAKYAIFLDGNEILAGAEGEIVANRFTVVEIGLESVTITARDSSATQRIPLQSN